MLSKLLANETSKFFKMIALVALSCFLASSHALQTSSANVDGGAAPLVPDAATPILESMRARMDRLIDKSDDSAKLAKLVDVSKSALVKELAADYGNSVLAKVHWRIP